MSRSGTCVREMLCTWGDIFVGVGTSWTPAVENKNDTVVGSTNSKLIPWDWNIYILLICTYICLENGMKSHEMRISIGQCRNTFHNIWSSLAFNPQKFNHLFVSVVVGLRDGHLVELKANLPWILNHQVLTTEWLLQCKNNSPPWKKLQA